MPTGEGPCRLGQYCKALEQVIIKNKIENVAVFSLTDEDGYAGLGNKVLIRGWQGVVLCDVFNEIKSIRSLDKLISRLRFIYNVYFGRLLKY